MPMGQPMSKPMGESTSMRTPNYGAALFGTAQAEPAQELIVIHRVAALGDGAHAEFRLVRVPDLPGHEHVKGGRQRVGHLPGDRHPAPRQGQHERPAAAGHGR